MLGHRGGANPETHGGMIRMKRFATIALMCLPLLAACGTDPELLQDPLYKHGYNDGCSTANSRVRGGHNKIYRNDTLFKEEKVYQRGWRDGYVACGDRQNPDGFGI